MPVGSSGGKKRRVIQSNSGARCAAKNARVELKKAEKSVESPSDDKVVSSSCEVDCSDAVSWSPSSPKTLPSRSSLDYFVHTTQKLEVTTSSTDGDLVDLTVEDEAASEAVALSSTDMLLESDNVDITPAATLGDCVAKELTIKPAEMEMKDESEKGGHIEDSDVAEVECSHHEDAEKPPCSSIDAPDNGITGSACAAAQLPDGRQNVHETSGSSDPQVVSLLDGQDSPNDNTTTRNTMTSAGESPLDVSSSDADDMDEAESSICDNTDNGDDKLSAATVVFEKLDAENIKASECSEKSELCVTSTKVNGDDEKVTGQVSQKLKVR